MILSVYFIASRSGLDGGRLAVTANFRFHGPDGAGLSLFGYFLSRTRAYAGWGSPR
jgi:hypothetical protein